MREDILDNFLVHRYFGGPNPSGYGTHDIKADKAIRILEAMQQPIRKGERYLCVVQDYLNGLINPPGFVVTEHSVEHELDVINGTWHPNLLRLPDAFQKTGVAHVWSCPCGVDFEHSIDLNCKRDQKETPKSEEKKCVHCVCRVNNSCCYCGYKPTPSSEKCDGECDRGCKTCYPDSAVEEKIKFLMIFIKDHPKGYFDAIQMKIKELVRIVRKEGKQC